MPFTPTHAVVALPFSKVSSKYVALTALVIGSMAPDLEYFLFLTIQRAFSHSYINMFFFELPLTILLTIYFQLHARERIVPLLPEFVNRKIPNAAPAHYKSYFKNYWYLILFWALIGIVSHIFWDSFTHPHGSMVLKFPVLQSTISIASFELPFYKLLQHGSTLVSLSILALYFFTRPSKYNHQSKSNAERLRFIIECGVIAFCIIALRFVTASGLGFASLVCTCFGAGLYALVINLSRKKFEL